MAGSLVTIPISGSHTGVALAAGSAGFDPMTSWDSGLPQATNTASEMPARQLVHLLKHASLAVAATSIRAADVDNGPGPIWTTFNFELSDVEARDERLVYGRGLDRNCSLQQIMKQL